MFSENLGLMEKKFEIKMFLFSNSFVFWEEYEILRSENANTTEISSLQSIYIYMYLKILFTVLIGQNLSMSSKCLENLKIWHSCNKECKCYKFLKDLRYRNQIDDNAFSLNARHYKLVSKCAKIQLHDVRI